MKKQDFKVLKTKDLYPFPDNPFHVAEDETLSELAESIKEFGIVTPIITRPKEDMAGRERQAEVGTVAELLEEIESENLYQVLVTVDGRTLKIVLLKMQGYSTKEIAPLVHLTTGAIYARLDHLRKKLRKIL